MFSMSKVLGVSAVWALLPRNFEDTCGKISCRKRSGPPCRIYDIGPKIPDRGASRATGDPSPYLINDLEKLIGWGAELLAVPCNTAHYFIDRFRDRIGVPIVHIIEATVEASMKKSKEPG